MEYGISVISISPRLSRPFVALTSPLACRECVKLDIEVPLWTNKSLRSHMVEHSVWIPPASTTADAKARNAQPWSLEAGRSLEPRYYVATDRYYAAPDEMGEVAKHLYEPFGAAQEQPYGVLSALWKRRESLHRGRLMTRRSCNGTSSIIPVYATGIVS